MDGIGRESLEGRPSIPVNDDIEEARGATAARRRLGRPGDWHTLSDTEAGDEDSGRERLRPASPSHGAPSSARLTSSV